MVVPATLDGENMGNFLGNLGAAIRGHQDYQKYLQQQEANDLANEQQKAKIAELQDLTTQRGIERGRQPVVAQGVLDYLTRQGQQGIPPPPPQQPVQPPMPGQASVPMEQPTAKFGPTPLGPQLGMMPQGLPPPPMGMPSQERQQPGYGPVSPMGMPPPPPGAPPMPQGMPPQGQAMPPQGPQTAPEAPGAIAPYQTIAGAANGAAAPMTASGDALPGFYPPGEGIAPPPQPAGPAKNSMSLQDAAQFIKSRGISDPVTGMQILEQLTPYLNRDAQQQQAEMKMQLLHQERLGQLKQRENELEEASKQKDLSREDKNKIEKEKLELRKEEIGFKRSMVDIARQNANTRASGGGGGGGMTPDEIEYWAKVYRAGGTLPPRMDKGDVRAVMKATASGTVTPEQMIANKAGQAGRTSEQRTIGTTSANVSMAGYEAENAAKILEEQSGKVWRSSFVPINKALNSYREQTGEPDVRAFGAAINTFVNTYARAISPKGVATVSDKEHARDMLSKADSPQQFNAIMGVLKQEMSMAQKVPQMARDKSRSEQLGTPNPHAEAPPPPKVGEVRKGYRFKGGDAHVSANWEKV